MQTKENITGEETLISNEERIQKARELVKQIDEAIGDDDTISEELIKSQGRAIYEIAKIFSQIDISEE